MENNLKLSTNYIIKSLFEQEYYYFTVRVLAGLLKIPIAKAYAIAARLDHIVAEKVRALLVRGMERDLYDKTYSHEEMIESIAKLEKTWTRTLSRCLGCLFHMMS